MRTVEYLRKIEQLQGVIDKKKERVESLKLSLMGQGIDYSKERVKTSPNDRFSATIALCLDEEKEVDNLILKRNNIIRQLEGLDSKHFRVLYAKFVENKRTKDIASELEISEKTYYSYMSGALREFEDKYGKTYIKLHNIT